MAFRVRVGSEDLEIDDELIDGALNLMACALGNDLDQETITKAQHYKRLMVAQRLEVTGPNDPPSRSRTQPRPGRLDIGPASTSRSRPGPSLENLMGLRCKPIKKQITERDVKEYNIRLPKVEMKEELKQLAMYSDEVLKKGIQVTVYGPDGREYNMNFKMWTNKSYVLNLGWKEFCQDYKLANLVYKKTTLTILMFLHKETDELCFALNW